MDLKTIYYIHPLKNNGGCSMIQSYTMSKTIPRLFGIDETDKDDYLIKSVGYEFITDSNVDIYPNSDFYIDSDVSVFINNSDIINFIKTRVGSGKVYIRLHSPVLSIISRKPRLDYALDEVFDEHIAFLKYVSDTSNTTFVVGNSMDYSVCESFGISAIVSDFHDIVTPGMNKGTFHHEEDSSNNNVLFVADYYTKTKGHLTYLSAIANSKPHEFEWYIVGDAFGRSEYKRDLREFPSIFKVLERDDVHLVGRVDPENMHNYYEICYHVVIPGFESYSLTAYEAFSYNCKVHAPEFTPLSNSSYIYYSFFDIGNFTYPEMGSNLYKKISSGDRSSNDYQSYYKISRCLATRFKGVINSFEDRQPYLNKIYTI